MRHSPVTALVWDIWLRHRTLVCLLIGVTLFTALLNIALPASLRMTEDNSEGFDATDAVELVNIQLILAAFLPFLAICGYTEFNAQTGSIGFPHRLFTLPLTSFQLVALPMFLGVSTFELLVLLWQTLIFRQEPNAWTAMLIGVYIVVHQTILWSLHGLGSLRMLILGVVGIVFLVALGLPSFPQDALPWWLRVNSLAVWLLGIGLGAFLTSWVCVARQRSGGGSKRGWVKSAVERISDLFPRRTKAFRSPAAAHFWFEWRRSGFMLPLLSGVMLIAVIGPLSWAMRASGEGTMRVLIAALAMPMVLALAAGKGFSKPDLWSTEMSVPSFVAVRPLSSNDLVLTKMKVAAASAAISWLLVCGFISLWLGLWASFDGINMLRLLLWSLYGRSVYPQYGLAVLSLIAAVLLTWRFLVSSLWLGLSGNRKLFALAAIPYVFAPLLAIAVLLPKSEDAILNWMQDGFGGMLPAMVRITAIAVVARFWLAAWSWRNIEQMRVRRYLLFWLCGTLSLVVLALLFWAGVGRLVPADSHQLRSLLIFAALLAIPMARLGLAPTLLARNRHRL